jgi:ribonuclease III
MLYPPRQKHIEQLLNRLPLPHTRGVNWQLLDQALTHPTAGIGQDYEQLEFVGDAVVRLVSSQFLFQHYGQLPVGEFAAIRAMLVSDRTLAQIAATYDLDRYLVLSDSARGDSLGRQTRLADALEACLGALYLSCQSMDLIHPWLTPHLHEQVEAILKDPTRQNYKAALQEWSQRHYKSLPEYRVEESDPTPGSEMRFTAQVWFQDRCLAQGVGRTIKAAQQDAAQRAYQQVQGS